MHTVAEPEEAVDWQLVHGRAEAPAAPRLLRAGPLEAQLDGIDLRYVRYGGLEVLRRLYVAVRDHNWDTIPGQVSDLRVEEQSGSFRVTFQVRHVLRDIDFSWRGALAGSADGTLVAELDGVANSAFAYNRIGICVLHPPEVAGRPFVATLPEGELRGELPDLIGPQPIVDGKIHPLFDSYTRLEIDAGGGVHEEFAFGGDLFEMEDQRNWTDASFKTYSTPLALGFPHQAEAGQRIAQSVTLRLSGEPPAGAPIGGPVVRVGEPLGRRLPPLGLGSASHGRPLERGELDLLAAVAPAHVRVDLRLGRDGWRMELARAAADARALGSALEPALFLGDDAAGETAELREELAAENVPVARVLVFREGESSTAGDWVRLARDALADVVGGAPFAGGTNAYFTDLNRGRPETAAMDAVAFSLNPQVHAFDDASLVETVAAQEDVVRSAAAFSEGLPIVVGPVTLRPRFNPNATGPEPAPAAGELPSQVDPRQRSLFGAAWTVGSAKHLSEAGAASVTYYETSGWRGVVERTEGSPAPDLFPSAPGRPFLLYHVLVDLAECRGAELLDASSTAPLAAEALALRSGDGLRVLLASFAPQSQDVLLEGLPKGTAQVRVLDAATAAEAAERPAAFRAASSALPVEDGALRLRLGPYAVARIDVPAAG
jgi:hypothetical protein